MSLHSAPPVVFNRSLSIRQALNDAFDEFWSTGLALTAGLALLIVPVVAVPAIVLAVLGPLQPNAISEESGVGLAVAAVTIPLMGVLHLAAASFSLHVGRHGTTRLSELLPSIACLQAMLVLACLTAAPSVALRVLALLSVDGAPAAAAALRFIARGAEGIQGLAQLMGLGLAPYYILDARGDLTRALSTLWDDLQGRWLYYPALTVIGAAVWMLGVVPCGLGLPFTASFYALLQAMTYLALRGERPRAL